MASLGSTTSGQAEDARRIGGGGDRATHVGGEVERALQLCQVAHRIRVVLESDAQVAALLDRGAGDRGVEQVAAERTTTSDIEVMA